MARRSRRSVPSQTSDQGGRKQDGRDVRHVAHALEHALASVQSLVPWNEGHNVGNRCAPIASVCGDHHRLDFRASVVGNRLEGAPSADFDVELCQYVRRDWTRLHPLRVVRVPYRPNAGLKAFRRKFAAVRQPMLDFKTRFPDRDDSRFDHNQVAEAHRPMEARPGFDQRKAGEIGPLQEIAFRQTYGLEDERGLGVRWSRNGSRGGLFWIGDRRIGSERCITLDTVRSLGVEPLIATTMPHARGFDPG
jgi:hypothetical protein